MVAVLLVLVLVAHFWYVPACASSAPYIFQPKTPFDEIFRPPWFGLKMRDDHTNHPSRISAHPIRVPLMHSATCGNYARQHKLKRRVQPRENALLRVPPSEVVRAVEERSKEKKVGPFYFISGRREEGTQP